MNWEAIGAIGEVLGAFAVVMTLLYLAVQVKYAKNATTDATRPLELVEYRISLSKWQPTMPCEIA